RFRIGPRCCRRLGMGNGNGGQQIERHKQVLHVREPPSDACPRACSHSARPLSPAAHKRRVDSAGICALDDACRQPGELRMAISRHTMTDEQRKSVALEYLKAFDNKGTTSSGGSILDLFADDAQVFFPKWGLASGKSEIGRDPSKPMG